LSKEKNPVNKINQHKTSLPNIDIREIYVNNKPYDACFDTGAAASFITSGLLVKMGVYTYTKEDKVFNTIDGNDIQIKRSVYIEFTYNNKTLKEIFYIVENSKEDSLLLSNSCVKKLQQKDIPVICRINTKDGNPIS
jgi:hypothetical protein